MTSPPPEVMLEHMLEILLEGKWPLKLVILLLQPVVGHKCNSFVGHHQLTMLNHPCYNLPSKISCWIIWHIFAVGVMNIHGYFDGHKQTVAPALSVCNKRTGNVMHEATQPVNKHKKYSNMTSRLLVT